MQKNNLKELLKNKIILKSFKNIKKLERENNIKITIQ